MIKATKPVSAELSLAEIESEKDLDLATLTPELLSMVGGGDGMVNI